MEPAVAPGQSTAGIPAAPFLLRGWSTDTPSVCVAVHSLRRYRPDAVPFRGRIGSGGGVIPVVTVPKPRVTSCHLAAPDMSAAVRRRWTTI
ncbi:MAG: hypothetical protein EA381_00125 [Planctomycetaceae bacterium]|nr:MAG: hypothetical protein EA381_00125 [Planctomycetaceae bacterium]